MRVFAVAFVALSMACGTQTKSAVTAGDTLTERERDSMLSTSGIPGARGVGAAMRVADSTSARIRAADSAP